MSARRFCLRCLRRTAIPITFGLPGLPPDREVKTPGGTLRIYDDPGEGPMAHGGCVQISAMPGVKQGLWFRWDRYRNPGQSGGKSFTHRCLRCGRLQGLLQEKRRRQSA